MQKRQDYLQYIIFFFFICSSLLLGQRTNTVTRENLPVVVLGQSLDTFLGLQISDLRLMKFNSDENSWQDIPFQFDELDSDDTYFGKKNGILNSRDELIFLSQDFGDSTNLLSWPAQLNSNISNRIMISGTDPLTGEMGWVYLYHSTNFELSNIKYIQVDESADKIYTEAFEIIHGESGFQEDLRFLSSASGDNLDFLDRQKFRLHVKISYSPLGDETISIKEQMDETESLTLKFAGISVGKIKTHLVTQKKSVEYVKNGNIRLHRKLILQADISFDSNDIDDYHLEFPFVSTYYPIYSEWNIDSLEIALNQFNTEVEIAGYTVDVKLKTKQIRVSTDLNSRSVGMRFINTYNPDGIKIDGRKNSFDDRLNWPGENWYLITANPDDEDSQISRGSLISYIPFASEPIGDAEIFHRDDKDRNSKDTGDQRSYGNSGIKIEDSNIVGYLDYYSANFYIPENIDTTAARTLIDQHRNSMTIETTSENRPFMLAHQINPSNTGEIIVDPDTNFFNYNEIATLTATPSYGFEFVSWSGDIESTENPLTVTMNQDYQVTANFEAKDVLIVIDTEPTGFPIYANYISYDSPRSFNWETSKSYIIFANRTIEQTNTRYLFNSWTHSDELTFNYLVPDTTDTLIAFYNTEYILQVSSSDSLKGTTNMTSESVWIAEDSLIILYPIPNPDYGFISWSGDIESTEDTLQFMMDSPKNIVANFANWPPQISLQDTSFYEDDTLSYSFNEINEWIYDENHPDSLLSLTFRNSRNLNFILDSLKQKLMIINQNPNWNGTDTMYVTVTDPTGISTSDYSIIDVFPVNDPPEPFGLLCPPNGMQYPTLPREALFNWEESFDIDIGDSLVYKIVMDTSSTFSDPIVIARDLTESHYLYPWPLEYGIATYYWKVLAIDTTGAATTSTETFTFDILTTTSVEDGGAIPKSFGLHQNMPNPFNNMTRIQFDIPEQTEMTLRIFNSRGQLIQTLFDGTIEAGYHHIIWDSKNNVGTSVASGMYFIQISAPKYHKVRKMLYIR